MSRRMLLMTLAILTAGGAPSAVQAWTTPAMIASTGQDSLDPRLSVDVGGFAHAVWRERVDGSMFRIWYSTDLPGAFIAPTEVAGSSSYHSYSPVVASDGSEVHVAWNASPSGNFEVWCRRFKDGAWGSVYNASNTAIKSLRPAIAVRNGHGPVVAWDEAIYADDNYDTYFSAWNGSGFSSAINISNTAGGAVYGSVNVNLAVSTVGEVTAVWAERITGDYHINARRRVGGVWQARQELSTHQTGPRTPVVDVDSSDRVHVVYEADDGIWYQYWTGVSWTTAQGLPGGLSGLIRPRIAVDASGFAHVVADAFTDAQNNRDLFYTTNAGGNWSAWVNLSNTPGTQSLNGSIGFGNGRRVVIWQENSNGSGGTDVYNTWYTASGPPVVGPSGSIAGTVTTPGGQPVGGAAVVAGGYFSTLSGPDGHYVLAPVPVGTWNVTASKAYYSSHDVSDVAVAEGQQTLVDFFITPEPTEPVASFSVSPDNTNSLLSWQNPTIGNFTGTMIRYRTDAYPVDEQDGVLLADRSAAPGSANSLVHAGLMNGTTYYYAAFAHTDLPLYASGVTAEGTPAGPADLDRDGDVDQTDFGLFQACLSGVAVPQTDPDCLNARLDGDTDVDETDLARFIGCVSGVQIPADSNCLDGS